MAAQGSATIAGPDFYPFPDESPDDLPRTVRREKEARAREARAREAQERALRPSLSTRPDEYSRPAPQIYRGDFESHEEPALLPATVHRLDVPFTHLARFFLKAVLAAIPALILLGTILWFAGTVLQSQFPQLIKMRILIGFAG
jgi:hypothetical protein